MDYTQTQLNHFCRPLTMSSRALAGFRREFSAPVDTFTFQRPQPKFGFTVATQRPLKMPPEYMEPLKKRRRSDKDLPDRFDPDLIKNYSFSPYDFIWTLMANSHYSTSIKDKVAKIWKRAERIEGDRLQIEDNKSPSQAARILQEEKEHNLALYTRLMTLDIIRESAPAREIIPERQYPFDKDFSEQLWRDCVIEYGNFYNALNAGLNTLSSFIGSQPSYFRSVSSNSVRGQSFGEPYIYIEKIPINDQKTTLDSSKNDREPAINLVIGPRYSVRVNDTSRSAKPYTEFHPDEYYHAVRMSYDDVRQPENWDIVGRLFRQSLAENNGRIFINHSSYFWKPKDYVFFEQILENSFINSALNHYGFQMGISSDRDKSEVYFLDFYKVGEEKPFSTIKIDAPSEMMKLEKDIIRAIDLAHARHLASNVAEGATPEELDQLYPALASSSIIKEDLWTKINFPAINAVRQHRYNGANKFPSGMLLVGPPGCGKTFVTSGIESLWPKNGEFIKVDMARLLMDNDGDTPKNIKEQFENAFKIAKDKPVIIFFDEADPIFRNRVAAMDQSTNGGGVNAFSTLIATALLEGVAACKENGVLPIVASNNVLNIEMPLIRSGRFDYLLYFRPPAPQERLITIQKALVGHQQSDDLAFERITANTAGYSYADLDKLMDAVFRAARIRTPRGQVVEVSMADFDKVLLDMQRPFAPTVYLKSAILAEQWVRQFESTVTREDDAGTIQTRAINNVIPIGEYAPIMQRLLDSIFVVRRNFTPEYLEAFEAIVQKEQVETIRFLDLLQANGIEVGRLKNPLVELNNFISTPDLFEENEIPRIKSDLKIVDPVDLSRPLLPPPPPLPPLSIYPERVQNLIISETLSRADVEALIDKLRANAEPKDYPEIFQKTKIGDVDTSLIIVDLWHIAYKRSQQARNIPSPPPPPSS